MERKRLNKRAQGLSTNAIILIVLGVIILVLLIAGFTIGWSNLLPFLSQDNVDTIVRQCETACASAAAFDYCKERELKFGDERDDVTVNCRGLEFLDVGHSSCSALSSGCYPLGAPESKVVEIGSEPELGMLTNHCNDGLKKAWRTSTKTAGDTDCQSFIYVSAKSFCCKPEPGRASDVGTDDGAEDDGPD